MRNLTSLAFALERDSKHPLFVQLCEQIRQRIADGSLQRDSPLPPSRGFAAELGVSRSTVVTAYEQLVAEGYIEGRPGSGYYVRELGASESQRSGHRPVPEQPGEIKGSGVQRPHTHPGFPDDRLFPYHPWARCLARSARLTPRALVVSDSPFGDSELRRAIATYLSDWRGLAVSPEQVLITAGSIDALETCLRTLARPGDIIGLENPGYQPLRHIADNQGMSIEWIPVGEHGAELPATPGHGKAARMVVLTPSQQFPLGGAMPISRRREYLQWAAAGDRWIIEDDYDSEFRYAGRPIPALASMDNTARTIYIGTFSKVFSVSLRLGYLVMPVPQIDNFSATLSRFGLKAALPCQRALADFIDNGDFYRHIRRVRRIYADRRRVLLEQIDKKLSPWVTCEDHQAGMQVTVRLEPGTDDKRVTAEARADGVLLAPLSYYYADSVEANGLLLGFCPCTEDEIVANIETLARIMRKL